MHTVHCRPMTLACPNCGHALESRRETPGFTHVCPKCSGRFVGLAPLRRMLARSVVDHAWQQAANAYGSPGRGCPGCGHPMVEVRSATHSGDLTSDVCAKCMAMWFDSGEFARLPVAPPAPPKDEQQIPPEMAEAFAMLQVQALQERHDSLTHGDAPDEMWKYAPAVCGLPVEVEGGDTARFAWACWIAVTFVVGVSLIGFSIGVASAYQFGFIPREALRMGGITSLSSFLIHAGPFHLIANAYTLAVFGDNVEDFLGWRRFTILLLAATVSGCAAHFAANPTSASPLVGASGGISGLIAFYALQFPRNRFALLVRWWWMRISAMWMVAGWVALQIFGAWLQLKGFSGVSAFAHLGGAFAGLLAWAAWGTRETRPTLKW